MCPMPDSGSKMAEEPDYSIFENKTGLAEDMKFLASMPELCDVTFLVGATREPVCAVKAVLAARSRSVNDGFILLILVSFRKCVTIICCFAESFTECFIKPKRVRSARKSRRREKTKFDYFSSAVPSRC